MFSGYIVGYLFCAGTGAGAFFIASASCMWDALRASDESERMALASEQGFFVAPCLMALACVLLMADLGVASRAWTIVLAPFQSMMSVGAWLVALLTATSVVLAGAGLLFVRLPRILQWTCCAVGLVLSAGTMAYTGLLLSSMVSIDFWHTPWLLALFVVSSLSCGAASILAAGALSRARLDNVGQCLWRLEAWLVVADAVCIIGLVATQWGYTDTARASCAMLLTGSLAMPFWGGVCGMGLLLPLGAHAVAPRRCVPSAALAASTGVLVAGALLRYCVVAAALFTPIAPGAL